MPVGPEPIVSWCRRAGYRLRPITAAHAVAVHGLPDVHRDRFDRLLVAQALTEPMSLVTHDQQVASYDPSIQLV